MDAWRLDCTGTNPKGELLTDVIKDQDAEITRLKAEIERKDELLKYIGNMYGDEMIGETDILERIEALQAEVR